MEELELQALRLRSQSSTTCASFGAPHLRTRGVLKKARLVLQYAMLQNLTLDKL